MSAVHQGSPVVLTVAANAPFALAVDLVLCERDVLDGDAVDAGELRQLDDVAVARPLWEIERQQPGPMRVRVLGLRMRDGGAPSAFRRQRRPCEPEFLAAPRMSTMTEGPRLRRSPRRYSARALRSSAVVPSAG